RPGASRGAAAAGAPGLGVQRERTAPPARPRGDRTVLRESGPLYVWGRPGAVGLPPRPGRAALAVVDPAGLPGRVGPGAPDAGTDSYAGGLHRLSCRWPRGRRRGGGGPLFPPPPSPSPPPPPPP